MFNSCSVLIWGYKIIKEVALKINLKVSSKTDRLKDISFLEGDSAKLKDLKEARHFIQDISSFRNKLLKAVNTYGKKVQRRKVHDKKLTIIVMC
jgi:hypothetical protein